MTIAALIEQLKGYDPAAPVFLRISEADEVIWVQECDRVGRDPLWPHRVVLDGTT